MLYRFLADVAVVVHFGFIIFVVFGGLPAAICMGTRARFPVGQRHQRVWVGLPADPS